MNVQSDYNRQGLLSSLPVQLGLLAVAVVVLIAVAWMYIW